ncbi:hypothetical protein [Acidovorax sp.]|uniref:hypothetical protein n=1 Tax=Acidovorax sp. TaxID=1872122 RepID=UPI0031C20ED1|nr:hypothetical protein [Lysobacter sp.]
MNLHHQPPAISSPHDRFDEALDLHRAGELDAAALRYEAILSDKPARAEVLAMLGALHLQRDQYEAAERSAKKVARR